MRESSLTPRSSVHFSISLSASSVGRGGRFAGWPASRLWHGWVPPVGYCSPALKLLPAASQLPLSGLSLSTSYSLKRPCTPNPGASSLGELRPLRHRRLRSFPNSRLRTQRTKAKPGGLLCGTNPARSDPALPSRTIETRATRSLGLRQRCAGTMVHSSWFFRSSPLTIRRWCSA